MTADEYLEEVLRDQSFAPDDPELATLRTRAGAVKKLLRNRFSADAPSVRDAGSYKKGTMIRKSYDFDILVYFDHETDVGDSLKEIRDAVKEALDEEYFAEPHRSALRIRDANEPEDSTYFHIDVVPGRFMEGDNGDVAIYQEGGDTGWMKTNPETHISHVQKSGVRDAIKLLKLWKHDRFLSLPTFVLELVTVKLLDGMADEPLTDQIEHVFTAFRDRADSLCVADPANSNNDLAKVLDGPARSQLALAADRALTCIEDDDWEAVFGEVEKQSVEEVTNALEAAAVATRSSSRPYSDGGR